MFKINFICLIVVIVMVYSLPDGTSQKMLLSVYYESKCPDSRRFILEQLQPAMRLLNDFVKLQLIPFGKAKNVNYGDDGFECQHGPEECLGNIVQECALYFMKDRSQQERLDYVACEMVTEAGTRGELMCTHQANLVGQTIINCVSQGKGTILQLESEYYTSLLNLTFVPTVTINGEFDQDIQDYAMTHLFGAVCSVEPELPPCAHHYNTLALRYVMQKPAKIRNMIEI